METVKRYWNQKYFSEQDVSRGVYDYHSVVGVALLCNGIVRNEQSRDSPFTFVWPFCSVGIGITSLAFEVVYLRHCLDENNIPDASEAFAFILLATGMVIITMCIFRGRNIIRILGDMMDDVFANVDNSLPEYRDLFFKHQHFIKKLTIGWITFILSMFVCLIGRTILQLIYQQLFANYTVDRVKPFIFKTKMDHAYRAPNYEMYLILQIAIVTRCGTYFLVHLHYNLHILCEFDLVILGWRTLFKFDDFPVIEINEMEDDKERNFIYDILKKRIKEICIRHRHTLEFFEHVNSLFGPVLFWQLLLTSYGLCISGFQVVHGIEKGQFDLFFVLLFASCFIQMGVPCFLGSLILHKASEVGFECYACGWETMKISNEIKLEILTFLLIANKSVATMALGLKAVSLKAFTSILQAARSYFIALRQFNKDICK